MNKSRNLIILISPQPQLILILLLIMLLKTNLSGHILRSHKSTRSTRSHSEQYRVNFILPDELPANHFIGNIPSQLPHFPFGSSSDLSVSTTLIDEVNLAPRLLRASDSGDLFTLAPIDRDNRDQLCGPLECCHQTICNFTVDVLFVHPKQAAVTVHVNLQLHDTNDNSPQFPQHIYSLWIAEDNGLLAKDKQRILRPSYELPAAKDLDAEPNGIVEYRLTGNRMALNTFQLNSNITKGQLSLSLRSGIILDYETLKEHIIKLTVHAIDGGQPSHTTQMLLVIHITDLNDNPPVFDKITDTIEVMENSIPEKPIYTIRAHDADSDDNALIRYSFGPGNPNMPSTMLHHFSFHPTTGHLRIRKALDYEQYAQRHIELKFIAQDAGNPPLSSTMKLHIKVKDANDNAPQLVVQSNRTIVEHTAPGQLALRLMVRDLDEVSRHTVQCFSDPEQRVPLRLENSPDNTILSIFTTASLDYELHAMLHYSITCMDNAEPKQITRFNLTVRVQDINDNAPVFRFPSSNASQGQFDITVSEGEPVNKLIFIVTADDNDSGDFGRVTYSLFETGMSTLPASKTSKFSGKQVSYVSYKKYFRIDSETGSIFLIRRLDYELTDTMVFGVMATDAPLAQEYLRKSSTARVVVHILDINDNPPYLVSSDQMKVAEHVPVGTNVGNVQFSDPDTGPAGRVTVKGLLSSPTSNNNSTNVDDVDERYNAEKYFKLTEDQQLVTIHQIDREATPWFVLRILAVDNGDLIQLATTASVTVSVVDVNDNSPAMIHPKPNSTVIYSPIKVEDTNKVPLYRTNNNQLDTSVLIPGENLFKTIDSDKKSTFKLLNDHVLTNILYQIRGSDDDLGENARLSYHLNPKCNGSQYFHVESETGYIRSRLTRLNVTKSDSSISKDDVAWIPPVGNYLFCVQLSDHGKPPLSTMTYFWLNITPAISKAMVKAMWPSDSAEYATLGVPNLDGTARSPDMNHNLSSLLRPDKMWGTTDISVSNIVISLMVAIFAITLFCALTASVLWAHSKHRKRRIRSGTNEKNQTVMQIQSSTRDECALKCDSGEVNETSNPLLTENSSKDNIHHATVERINDVNPQNSYRGSSRVLTPSSDTNMAIMKEGIDRQICSGFQSTNLCDLVPCKDKSRWHYSRYSPQNNHLLTSHNNTLDLSAKDVCAVHLTHEYPSSSMSDYIKSKQANAANSAITEELQLLGSLTEPVSNAFTDATSYGMIATLPRSCPKHGAHYLLHSEALKAEQYEISLPTTVYTVNQVLDTVSTSESLKTSTVYPVGFDTIYTNSSQTATLLDKAISWVPLPLISESIETPATAGFLYIDPLKPVEHENNLPVSQNDT